MELRRSANYGGFENNSEKILKMYFRSIISSLVSSLATENLESLQ